MNDPTTCLQFGYSQRSHRSLSRSLFRGSPHPQTRISGVPRLRVDQAGLHMNMKCAHDIHHGQVDWRCAPLRALHANHPSRRAMAHTPENTKHATTSCCSGVLFRCLKHAAVSEKLIHLRIGLASPSVGPPSPSSSCRPQILSTIVSSRPPSRPLTSSRPHTQ